MLVQDLSEVGRPTFFKSDKIGVKRLCYVCMSPVVIVLVSDGKRCLLGRQSSFPRGLYSALAGFCDIGESHQLLIHLVMS
uniref:Nudix hydrolase domain-containing protein n=1 Tax=Poecilia mexicana TaxID=48701 RepID=A0A3B3WZM0_9TELE